MKEFFCWDIDDGMTLHATARAAEEDALDRINDYRDEARSAGEWGYTAETVCWGVIMGRAIEVDLDDDKYMDYTLSNDWPLDFFKEILRGVHGTHLSRASSRQLDQVEREVGGDGRAGDE